MIYIILYIQTAILFYLIGKYSCKVDIMETATKVKRKLKKKPKAGVLPFKTTEELEYEKSGEKAVDDEWREGMSTLSEKPFTP